MSSHRFRRVVGIGVHFVWLSNRSYISFLLMNSKLYWCDSFVSVVSSGGTLALANLMGACAAGEGSIRLTPNFPPCLTLSGGMYADICSIILLQPIIIGSISCFFLQPCVKSFHFLLSVFSHCLLSHSPVCAGVLLTGPMQGLQQAGTLMMAM